MGLRINTNLASIAAQRQINLAQRQNEGAMKALASGNRFDNPNESSADYAIAEHLRGQIAGVQAGQMNAENAQSFIQIAEGGLNEQNNALIRMRELAVQAASDTFSDDERSFLNEEFEQLKLEVDRIAQTTQFGSQKLLAGDSKDYEFQVGAYGGAENVIHYKLEANTTSDELAIDDLTLEERGDARDALETLDEALHKVASARSGFGSIHSRLDSTINHAAVQGEALQQARSRLADTDVAKAVSEMYKSQVLQQYQIKVLNEANHFPGSIVNLVA